MMTNPIDREKLLVFIRDATNTISVNKPNDFIINYDWVDVDEILEAIESGELDVNTTSGELLEEPQKGIDYTLR